jgi:hypothetical protein
MLAKVPPVAEIVISLNQFHNIAFHQRKLIRAPGGEIICEIPNVSQTVLSMVNAADKWQRHLLPPPPPKHRGRSEFSTYG